MSVYCIVERIQTNILNILYNQGVVKRRTGGAFLGSLWNLTWGVSGVCMKKSWGVSVKTWGVWRVLEV